MKSKQCRDKETAPYRIRDSEQQQKQNHDIQYVKHEIGQVMAGRVQSVKLTIKGMREPRERVPVLRISGIKGPDENLPTQSPVYNGIVDDIVLIVKIDKRIVGDRAINSRSPDDQKQARENNQTLAFRI